MTKMDKQYIEKEYEQAIKEYNAALTEDDLDTANQVYTMYQKAQDNFILGFCHH